MLIFEIPILGKSCLKSCKFCSQRLKTKFQPDSVRSLKYKDYITCIPYLKSYLDRHFVTLF